MSLERVVHVANLRQTSVTEHLSSLFTFGTYTMKKQRTSTPVATSCLKFASMKHVSNEPLPDTQKLEVKLALRSLQMEEKLMEEEILRVQLVIGSLLSQLETKQEKISTLKGMVSPIKHLPNEIISMIFEEYTVGLLCPPWVLGHICSRWRRIALATPKLWDNMVVRFRNSFQTCRNFDKYKTLFHRSGSRLISCTLISSTSSRSTHYFLPQFIQIASHVRHLSLEGAEAFLQFLRLPPGKLSSLETLSLKFFPKEQSQIPEISWAGETHKYDPITLFEDAPLLRRVNIATGTWDQWINPRILPLQLPWDQLTHLLLSPDLHFRDSVLSSVLHRCTNLIQLRVSIPYRDQGAMPQISIDLRHLEALEIVQALTNDVSSGQLLRHLVLPSLKRLSIMSRGGAFLPLEDVAACITESVCDIEVFHLRSGLRYNSVPNFLENIPSLTKLLVEGVPVLIGVLQRMVAGDFLPNLRSIECRYYEVFDDTPDKLIEVMRELMERPSKDNIALALHMVTDGEKSIAHLSNGLHFSRLNASFKQIWGKLYETEYELA